MPWTFTRSANPNLARLGYHVIASGVTGRRRRLAS
jgi:hypothetical protein